MAEQQTPTLMPGRSYYGFFLYIFGWLGILSYLLWALVPHSILNHLGISYLPQRYWALAIPSILVLGVLVFITLVYPGLNMLLCLSPDDVRHIRDEHSVDRSSYGDTVSCGDSVSYGDTVSARNSVPPVYDLDAGEVCQKLYRGKS